MEIPLLFDEDLQLKRSVLLLNCKEKEWRGLQIIQQIVFLSSLFYFFLILSPTAWAYQYDLSICSVFQNEAPYIKEWIEFHKLVGVQHFYLYNNLSQDDYLTVLKPYIENGEVELFEWPFESRNELEFAPVQCSALDNATKISYGKTKWLACLDLDEFLFPVQTNNLVEFLKNYDEFAGIAVNWQHYGTSHVKFIPKNKLMIEMLLMRAPYDYWDNQCLKSIVKPEYVERWSSVHYADYKPGYFQVNSNKVPFQGLWAPYIVADKIRINHYWVRDEHYFLNVKIIRRAKWGVNYAEMIKKVEKMNREKDDILLRFVPQLRQKMGYDELRD